MKLIVFILVILISISTKSQNHNYHVGTSDVSAHHGSLILGNKIYMYHIADHSLHNYQAILEIELDKDAQQTYFKDKKEHPEYNTYTIKPELFVLPDMINNPHKFKAKFYRGNFTNNKGEPIPYISLF